MIRLRRSRSTAEPAAPPSATGIPLTRAVQYVDDWLTGTPPVGKPASEHDLEQNELAVLRASANLLATVQTINDDVSSLNRVKSSRRHGCLPAKVLLFPVWYILRCRGDRKTLSQLKIELASLAQKPATVPENAIRSTVTTQVDMIDIIKSQAREAALAEKDSQNGQLDDLVGELAEALSCIFAIGDLDDSSDLYANRVRIRLEDLANRLYRHYQVEAPEYGSNTKQYYDIEVVHGLTKTRTVNRAILLDRKVIQRGLAYVPAGRTSDGSDAP